MNNPNFSYYAINRKTKYIVAGFDSALDANAFVAKQLHDEYTVVSRSEIAQMYPEHRAS
ncbi:MULTISPECIES: hypothetical protein [Burkholderia cepacia complex]|uniref:hypothetical protein n=1 Tax=Burkholderia cepacia complex TaxID=87882 RepID=UPI000AFF269F|nr:MULTISPECIES: hypothetical protein [Burkholderia cepacia complex]